jgi:hypothetical protein
MENIYCFGGIIQVGKEFYLVVFYLSIIAISVNYFLIKIDA